ncbi:LysR family transcriptional regulator [Cellulosimicrobium funkei]|uniref:LysR family transcriptional regulator n=1 Tax=Cellulosimicrobium funkei TaxID=264251 RepID=A0A4Y8R3T9_9MICO|nr:LysR family transcriptional regulator [Cellulosimicrobium funkei]TFF12432.1 LysR family transcriptional regulator [Cellulosimicrobium funkei]TGA77449.1 LysR family transcriptional regulator [Cellulosimicrobium terreum]
MSTIDQPTVQELRRLRSRRSVTELSYQRTLRALATTMTQSELAAELHVTQSAVSQALKTARIVDDVRPGFSGASPYEIAQRYAAGELDRDRALEELMRWPYDPVARSDGYDALVVDAPGAHTLEEVVRAYREGLIDQDMYVAVGQAHQTN